MDTIKGAGAARQVGTAQRPRRAGAAAVALLAGLTAGRPARAADASAWVAAADGAAARLVAGGPVPGSADLLAGVQLRLPPGAVTYWRDPGESGMAPSFQTAGSTNVASVAVDYPAPRRMDEAGSAVFGYAGGVTFPLRVRRLDDTRPATLALDLRYAVCAAQCLPAGAQLTLDLSATPPAPDVAALLAAARASVPRRAGLGDPAVPGIDRVVAEPDGSAFRVRARADNGAALFVEGPPGWFFGVGPAGPDGPGAVSFRVSVDQRPEGAGLAGLRPVFTLVERERAVEVEAPVDTAAPAR